MRNFNILLSTYNGALYLREQMDSLLGQDYPNFQVYVRDDGSTDCTREILESYEAKDARVHCSFEANVGPAQSFMSLLQSVPPADFYAFCDQDDVWDRDKLSEAYEKIKKEPTTLPLCYYSNLRIVDEHLNFVKNAHLRPYIAPNVYSALIHNNVTGCTCVFNNAAYLLIKERCPSYCLMHDYWVYLICMFFGNVIYDFVPHISYRQHGNNVVGYRIEHRTNSDYFRFLVGLFKKPQYSYFRAVENFMTLNMDILPLCEKEKIQKLLCYDKSFVMKIKVIFDKDFQTDFLLPNLIFKIRVLLGTF